MSRLIYAASLVLAGTAACAAPAVASGAPAGDKVNMVIIYGDDACPQSTGDEITVCARKAESERYRIPEPLRESNAAKNESWTNRVTAYETVGATGTQSCSPVGAGGWTGCEGQLIHNAYAERKQSSDVQFGKMIQAEREKRLSTIDADAAAAQARVEAAEKDYDARQRAQQDPAGSNAPAPAPSPAPAN